MQHDLLGRREGGQGGRVGKKVKWRKNREEEGERRKSKEREREGRRREKEQKEDVEGMTREQAVHSFCNVNNF